MRASLFLRVSAAPCLLLALSCADLDRATGPALELRPHASLDTSVDLLDCPSSTTVQASAVIGPEGGSVKAGGHRLRIPAGVLSAPQTFTVTAPASQVLEVEFRAEGHDHFQFAAPVLLTLNYDRCVENAAGQDLHVYYIDPATGAAVEDLGGRGDPGENSITAETTHLSDYAVGTPY